MVSLSCTQQQNLPSLPLAEFEERLDLGKFVTPRETKNKPIHNWFVYPHSFSPSLVVELIKQFDLRPGDRIYDPFAGAGTTILTAKENNISATGLDLLPVSVGLTTAKITTYDLETLSKNIEQIKQLLVSPIELNDEDPLIEMAKAQNSTIAKAFSDQVLKEIIKIKTTISQCATSIENYNFLLVGLLALLEGFSHTEKSGGWLKVVETPRLNGHCLVSEYESRLDKMWAEIKAFQNNHYSGQWEIRQGDARQYDFDLGHFKAVISSPPYLNRHDYTRVLALELFTGFLEIYSEITQLRYNLLRSHVEARPQYDPPTDYVQPDRLVEVVEQLQEQKAEKRILRIVDGYFEDMFMVLKAVRESLTNGGYAAFVLGNVRFTGVSIPVDEIVTAIGASVGLAPEKIMVARRRNNSAQQMRDFGRDPARESIIIWRAT